MPQHAPAELARPVARVAEPAPRRAAVGDGAEGASTVQRALDDSPRVAALERMGETLAQRQPAGGPVVQRRVGPDEGRPGMEVIVRATGVRGSLLRPDLGSSGEAVGWVVNTPSGVLNLTFDDVDAAPVSLATSLLLGASLSPSQPSPPLSVPLASGSPPVISGGRASSLPLLSSPSAPSAVVTDSVPSSSVGAPPEADSVVRDGDGVEFSTNGRDWHEGYVTQIRGSVYDVYIDSKIIREMYPYSTLHLSLDQIRTSPQIKERMGAKRTKSSKREYRADLLASHQQLREVQGLSAAVSPLLLRHPVLFGPVLRSGGHIGTAAVSAIGKDRGMAVSMPLGTKGKARNRQLAKAIVATDTNAMLVTRLDDASTGPGQWVLHGKAASNEAADHPTLNETELAALRDVNLAEFRRRFVFSQGSIKGDAVSGHGKRTQLHAEAKAVRSRTWRHILDQTVAEFTLPASSSSASSSEPAREPRRKIIGIVINRSSCGAAKKGSGFTGGCALELAEVITAFWAELGARLGVERVARLRAQGIIRIEVSAAGQYENEGKIDRIAAAGARLALHPNYDFDRDMPEPLSVARYQYLKRLDLINSGRLSGSGSGSDDGGDESSEFEQWLALLFAQRAERRRPLARVALGVGQHQVRGMFNRQHSGRIACTSIAACALEQMLNSPGERVDQHMLMTMMAAGTDIDADLRRNLRAPRAHQGPRSLDKTSSPPLKRRTTGDHDGAGPFEPFVPSSGSRLPFGLPTVFSPAPSMRPSGPPPSFFRSLMLERPVSGPSLDRLLMPPPPPRMLMPPRPPPRLLLESRPPSSPPRPPSEAPAVSVVRAQEPPSASSSLLLPLPSPSPLLASSELSGPRPATAVASAPVVLSGRKRKAKRERRPVEEIPPEERYFAHDEVEAQFRGMEVDQAAVAAVGPQYLTGVRGDYRRIARRLAQGGPRTGMLVTIGGATIMVANLSTRDETRFALFDSHGQAVFEIYATEQGLADAIDDIYPDLADVDELDAAWYATPYRPTR